MARWMHPRPRFGVVQRVITGDCPAQTGERTIVVFVPILQLAIQHGRADAENVPNGIAEENCVLGNCGGGLSESALSGLRLFQMAECGVCHGLPVGIHCNADRLARLLVRGTRFDQLAPAAKANLDVRAHGGVAVQDGGHEGRTLRNQIRRCHRADSVGGIGGFAVLAEKHGGVHEHMKVMTSRRGVEVLVAGRRKIPVVRADRAFALR